MRIRNGLKKFFCLRSNLSNDNIISAERPGLKTGMENYIFWSEIGSGFDEPGGLPPPPKNSQEYPPPRVKQPQRQINNGGPRVDTFPEIFMDAHTTDTHTQGDLKSRFWSKKRLS